MPTGEAFWSRGKGEGFPYAVSEVDVSGYDYWTTLGGWNKTSVGSVTGASIAASWDAAMKLYWRLYRVNMRAYLSKDDGVNVSEAEIDYISERTDKTPRERITNVLPRWDVQNVAEPDVPVEGPTLQIARYFDGATEVGFGIKPALGLYATEALIVAVRSVGPSLRVRGALTTVADADPTTFDLGEDFAYVDIDGIHLVCRLGVIARTGTYTHTTTLDAPGLRAQATADNTTFDQTYDVDFGRYADPLEFYASPA